MGKMLIKCYCLIEHNEISNCDGRILASRHAGTEVDCFFLFYAVVSVVINHQILLSRRGHLLNLK